MPRPDPAFKLKNAQLPLFVLHVLTTDPDLIKQQLERRVAQTPEFFVHTPVVLGLAAIAERDEVPDFAGLTAFMRALGLYPAGIQGGSAGQRAAAAAAGLGLFMDSADRSARPEPEPQAPPAETEPQQAELPGLEPSAAEAPVAGPANPPPGRRPSMLIDKPVRTGQRIYAEDADLVVLAIVNAGAELIADGDIHIYAPLRGRALAGARGDTSARIYTQAMEAELVAIAGLFHVFEDGIPADVRGQPAQVYLEGERVVARPLSPARR